MKKSPSSRSVGRVFSVPALLLGAGLVAAIAPLSPAQVDWVSRSSTLKPPARQRQAIAYDLARGRTVLFGGLDVTLSPLGDTWEWDGAQWTALSPASSPSARYGHAMAYDASSG